MPPKPDDKPGGSFVQSGAGTTAPPAFYAQHQVREEEELQCVSFRRPPALVRDQSNAH